MFVRFIKGCMVEALCIIISEVINRVYRFCLNNYNKNNNNLKLKEFRKKKEFLKANKASILFKSIIGKLGPRLTAQSGNFQKFNVRSDFFKYLEGIDFNDLIILKICKECKVDFLVTNDRDMFGYKDEVNILTALEF